ncbi:MAG: hypothetical protein DRJ96_01940 [Thermoprotei archaeon]|nr:MAG: hypothetical protein DRJ96_01940 [Thermoprotei archaeon]
MSSFSYAIAGQLAKRLSRRAGVFKDIYYTAGFSEPFDAYLSRCITAYLFTAPAVTITAFVLHSLILRYPPLFSAILTFLLLIIYSLLFLAFVLYYPVYRRYARGLKIDSRIPYTISYFAALAAAGMGIEALMERIAEVEDVKEVAREFALFLTDVKVLGFDVLTALERRSRMSPSIMLSLFFAGLRDTYITVGNLYEYAAFMARRLMELKRYTLRSVLNSISMVAEVYITLMVAAPLMFVTMLAIMGMLGGTIAGFPPQLIILILLIVGIPTSAIAVLLMLDGILSRV